jgi:hypothetical protein
VDPQESVIPALLILVIDPQIDDQHPVLPVENFKFRRSVNNPYVNPPVHQLVVNKAANTIHSPEDDPTKDCYGWDPMLDGEDDDSNSNQNLDMPDDLHGRISGDTWRMMDQQVAHPTHASVGLDFMGLEDTLNDVLQGLGETVASNPAQEIEAIQPPQDVVLHDPILWPQTIEVQY